MIYSPGKIRSPAEEVRKPHLVDAIRDEIEGFSTCCLRFTNGVATIHARLTSGWLARLYREGVEPSGSR
jgi:hypothetical protein